MRKVQIILIFKNYLLCSGIEQLLRNEMGLPNISKFISFDEISESSHNFSESLIILESEFLKAYQKLLVTNSQILSNSKVLLVQKLNQKNISKELIDGILKISSNKAELAEIINKQISLLPKPNKKNQTEKTELSEREKTVVKFVALGKTANEIAKELFLSSHTVITHRKNISKKLGIKTVSGLTVYAILNNIVSFDEINLPL